MFWRYTIPSDWIRAGVHHLVMITGWPFLSRSWSHSGSYSFIYSPSFYHSGTLLTLIDSFSPTVKIIQAQPEGKSLCYINYHSNSSFYVQNSQMISVPLLDFFITYTLSAMEIWFPLSLTYKNCTLEGHPWFSNHQIQRLLFYFSFLLIV